MQDKVAHGTHGLGERNPAAKLTEADVRAIRADTRGPVAIARQYGISHPGVIKIKQGLIWKHV